MKKQAFTLIELLAVIVVVAILATIAVSSVSVIINKTRINSLNDVAWTVKRAAGISITNREPLNDSVDMNFTPQTGTESFLIDLTRDPWGKDYVSITTLSVKNISGKYDTEVIIVLQNGDIWVLLNGEEKIIKASPLLAVGVLMGSATTGSTLTAGSLNPSGATGTYQWQRSASANGTFVNVAGAKSETYAVSVADFGQYLRVKVTGTGAYVGSAFSDPSSIISTNVTALLVAGGGGGALAGSGGGAGGYIYNTDVIVAPGSYTITVGNGGIGGTWASANALNGSNSNFAGLTAIGGGGGVTHGGVNGKAGGSGSGGSISGGGSVIPLGGLATAGQGNAGGSGHIYAGFYGNNGGGGGAGTAGRAGCYNIAGCGDGGTGLFNNITGSNVAYAGGGGGGELNDWSTPAVGGSGGGGNTTNDGNGSNGTNGLGGGGGGGSYNWNGTYYDGGAGGSGVVIIKYLNGQINASGGTKTINATHTIHVFLTGGNFVIN